MPTALLLAAGLLVIGFVLSGSFVRSLIYPKPPFSVGPPPAGYQEIYWTLDDGVEIHGWHGGSASGPVVIFFHGNGENLGTLGMSGLFERWRELGVYAIAVEYPGYGKSGGRPSSESTVAAGLAAYDWAQAELPGRPLLPVGWSLGAAVAIQVAAARPESAEALVLLSAWSRLSDVAGSHFPRFLVSLLLHEEYDSMAAAAAIDCPTLVVHGEQDRIIPVDHGRLLAERLGGRARWVTVSGSGHNDLLGRFEVWSEIADFLEAFRPSSDAPEPPG